MKEIKVRVDDRVVDELKKEGSINQLLRSLIVFYLSNEKQLKDAMELNNKLVLKKFIKVKELEKIKNELNKEINNLYSQYGEVLLALNTVKLLSNVEGKARNWLRQLTINDIEGFDELRDKLPDFVNEVNELRKQVSYLVTQLSALDRRIRYNRKRYSGTEKVRRVQRI